MIKLAHRLAQVLVRLFGGVHENRLWVRLDWAYFELMQNSLYK